MNGYHIAVARVTRRLSSRVSVWGSSDKGDESAEMGGFLDIYLRSEWSTVSPYQNKRPIFGPLFDFLFCRFRLTRNVKGFLLGGRELSPNRPEKCQISSEMSANSQQMVPCRPDRRGGRKGSRSTRSLDTRRKRRSGELHVYVESTDPVGDRQDDPR